MCHTESNFKNFPESSNLAQQPNIDTRPLRPVEFLSIEQLCQEFVTAHCLGHKEAARPYLAELLRRQDEKDQAESEPKPTNGDYFTLLRALAGKVVNCG